MFDRSLPHDQIIGIPGVQWTQRGRYYTADGRHVLIERGVARAAPEPEPEPEPEQPQARKGGRPKNIENRTDAELQAQLAIYGEPWQGREAAVAYLKAHAE